MSKSQMIELIRTKNRSANTEFLSGFDEASLQSYLRRLTELQGHRGRQSIWVRQTQQPAVVFRAVA